MPGTDDFVRRWRETRPAPPITEGVLELTDRERLVFKAIVHIHVRTAEPVGSRAVARFYRMGISPATIRNVMMDLEEKGLVDQPHTSAGRVPTDRGYRFYVNAIMRPEGLARDEIAAIERVLEIPSPETESILSRASLALSSHSEQLAVAFPSTVHAEAVARIDTVRLDPYRWLLVVTGQDGTVRTALVLLEEAEVAQGWERALKFLNDTIAGLALDEVARERLRERLHRHGLADDFLCRMAVAALEDLEGMYEIEHLHFGGTGNIMSQPEFRNSEDLRGLFQAIEARQPILRVFRADGEEEPGRVNVHIGAEIPHEGMRSMSVVSSLYGHGENRGYIGVIGPTRMNYPRLVSLVFHTAAVLTERVRNSQ